MMMCADDAADSPALSARGWVGPEGRVLPVLFPGRAVERRPLRVHRSEH